jgi:hypothetical protein
MNMDLIISGSGAFRIPTTNGPSCRGNPVNACGCDIAGHKF